ncbi:MAG: orotate phosphoribosyltransferase [Mucinivorans sp.]
MEKAIALSLLQIKAIKLSPQNPFTWASGWHSPIYCDNRKILSFVDARKLVARSFAQIIQSKYADVDVIAGVATGAIAWGLMAAELLDKPFIYVRSAAKNHGLTNQVEGYFEKGQKVVVVEDLISTGGSSLAAVEALRGQGLQVMGMVAIFTYGFPVAQSNFQAAGVDLTTLSNYNILIQEAIANNYVQANELATLKEWRLSPETWQANTTDK